MLFSISCLSSRVRYTAAPHGRLVERCGRRTRVQKKKRKTKVWIGSEANSLTWRRIVKMEACMLAKASLTKRWKKRHVPWLNVSLQDGYINMSNLFRQFSAYLLSVCKSCFKEHNRLHNHTYICITVHMGNSVRSVTNLSISNALVLGRNFYILFEIE